MMRVDAGPTAEADKDCPKHIQPGAVLETRIVAVGKTEDHTTKSYFAVIQQRVHDAAEGAGSWSKADRDPVAVKAAHIIALDSASKLEFRPGTNADVKAVSSALAKFGAQYDGGQKMARPRNRSSVISQGLLVKEHTCTTRSGQLTSVNSLLID